jgi:hypothetical protein
MNDYVFVLMESELHEGTYLRGIFTSRDAAEDAMKEQRKSKDNAVFSYWIDTQYLNQIIRD